MEDLWKTIKACTRCAADLPLGPNPVIAVGPKSRIVIIGQAPGRVVHHTNLPWNDKSGDNLRQWMGVDRDSFYNTDLFSLMPMGFCYPGTGKSGDLPPRKECAPLYHRPLLEKMPKVSLTLLVGQYAQRYYLGQQAKKTLTHTVQAFEEYLPRYFPLPHPSPRNNIWQAKNPWFKDQVLPHLYSLVQGIVHDDDSSSNS
ncbi:uracil-DNA glycosylase [Dyadobacter jejuensis]|uniref:Uracil-DNA glycosylase n=1 Tax=Dyadobacter jejuensis TaxID=1082580 RepID=A0A316AV35_9BACT|nr:uracil-DNA glycosylase family protein [Dyadobacter jejuensis]PWJ60560.1 uracil-DNA glycosylase [Dyadobacter jejuensis]